MNTGPRNSSSNSTVGTIINGSTQHTTKANMTASANIGHNGRPVQATAKPSMPGQAPPPMNGAKRPVIGGGIKVTTVKRAVAPPSQAAPKKQGSVSASSSSLSTAAPRLNALPEEMRIRIEEARRERERKQTEEQGAARANSKPRSGKTSTSSSRPGTPKKRKKRLASESGGSDDDDDLFGVSGASAAANSKRGKSRSREQSASAAAPSAYKKLGRFGVLPYYDVPRKVIDDSAFEGSGVVGDVNGPIQSADLVHNRKFYGPFFHNLGNEPKVELEYPALGAKESFILLVPKERDEYDPVSDLLRTVRCIVEHYLTPEQQQLFGPVDSLETASAAGNILHTDTREAGFAASPIPSRSSASREVTPAASNSATDESSTTKSSQVPPLSPARSAILASATESATAAAAATAALAAKSDSPSIDSILRSFTKARNRRDGPLFVRTLERFNDTLGSLKANGSIRENVRDLGQRGVPDGLWRCVQEQCYARTVSPHVEELAKYTAFSDNVYGELLPRFMSEVAQLTELGPESVFVDLGSGVGNLLIQVALQTGSQAYGCEQMAAPSKLARAQVLEAQRRWRLWGLAGARTEAWEGDFGESADVRNVLRHADVILVNNYAFTSTTNDKLSWQFLDLKDGAHIVSLKPFVPPDFRVTERTMSSPQAILKVAERTYSSGYVSWGSQGGKFYIHTVDRANLAKLDAARGDTSREG